MKPLRTTFVMLLVSVFLIQVVFAGQISCVKGPDFSNQSNTNVPIAALQTENQSRSVDLPIHLQAGVSDDPIVTFTRSGAYAGVWSVCFEGMRTNGGGPISFSNVPNGTYNYTAYAETSGWLASPSSGQVTVSGSNVTINITFTANPVVTFTRSGAYVGVWGVCLEGQRNTGGGPISFPNVPNGTYNYTVYAETAGWVASPSSGQVIVDGSNVTVNVTFTANPTVTFTRSGAYAGVWSVCFEGMRTNGGGPISFSNVPNGTYNYTVNAETDGWMPSPQSGTITVSGANITVNVAFVAYSAGSGTSNITITGTGLPSNTMWGASVAGNTRYSYSNIIEFKNLPNGNYPFVILSSHGYNGFLTTAVSWGAPTPQPFAGTINLIGTANLEINFAPPTNLTFSQTGTYANPYTWSVSLGGVCSGWYIAPNITFYNIPKNVTTEYIISDGHGYNGFFVGAASWSAPTPLQFAGTINLDETKMVNVSYLAPSNLTFTQTGNAGMWALNLGGISTGWYAAPSITLYNIPKNVNINYVVLDSSGYSGFLRQNIAPAYCPSSFQGSTRYTGVDTSNVSIVFRRLPTISFAQLNLPASTLFTINAQGQSQSTYSNVLSFVNAPFNNTIEFEVNPPSGYYASPSNGSLGIDIFDFIQLIVFTTTPPTGQGQTSTSTLTVKVNDTLGKPVPGVSVTLYDQTQRPIGAIETDSAGNTSPIQTPAAIFLGVATRKQPYFTPTLKPMQLSPGINTATIQLTPYPTGTVTGYVREQNGTAISGALITASQTINGVDFVSTAYTSTTGQYTMSLLSGLTNVRTSAPAHYAPPQNVTVPESGTATLNTIMNLLEQSYVTVNIYTKYLGDAQYTGPMSLDRITAVHLGVWLTDAIGASYLVTENPFPLKGYAGETVQVAANGIEASLPAARASGTLDANRNATLPIYLAQQGLVKATVKGGSPPQPVSSWTAQVYLISAEGSRAFATSMGNNSADLAFYPPNPGQYEIDLQGYSINGETLGDSVTVTTQPAQVLDIGVVLLEPAAFFTGKVGNGVTAVPDQAVPGQELELRATYRNSGTATLSNVSLLLEVPFETSVIPGSVTLNRQQVNATRSSSFYVIPIGSLNAQASGMLTYRLRLSASITDDSLNPRVLIYYLYASQQHRETIGTAFIMVDQVTISAPSVIGSLNTAISGTAPPTSTVVVLDNYTALGQVTASSGGYWTINATLPNGNFHELHAQAFTPQGSALNSTTVDVIYDPTEPQLVLVSMQQINARKVTFNPQEGVAQFPYVYWPNNPIYFEFTFTKSDKVLDVYVSVDGAGIADATFCSDGLFRATLNPGPNALDSIYVGYTTLPYPTGDDSLTPFEGPTPLPPEFSDAVFTLISNTDTHFQANISLSNGLLLTEDVTIVPDVNYTVTENDIENAAINGYPIYGIDEEFTESSTIISCNTTLFIPFSALPPDLVALLDAPPTGEQVLKAGQKIRGLTVTARNTIEKHQQGINFIVAVKGTYDSFTGVFKDGEQWLKLREKFQDLQSYRMIQWYKAVKNKSAYQTVLIDQKFQQIDQRLDSLQKKADNVHFWRIVGDDMSAPGNWLPGKASTASSYAFKGLHLSKGVELDKITRQLGALRREYRTTVCPKNDPAVTARPRWIIDPSGYVYEGLSSNRIANVTASIFYQDQQTGQWLLWDATEYGQQNNLLTDAMGNYGWYVPQGKWMVTYQKTGYQTVQSNAFDIPPPALDVNIGLTPLAVPNVTAVSASTNILRIQFSQYMRAGTLNQNNIYVTLGGTNISGTLTAFNSQPDPNSVLLTKEARFTPTSPFQSSSTYVIHVDKLVQNFAASSMSSSYVVEFTVQPTPTYKVSTSYSMVPIGGPVSALAQTSDPGSKAVEFSWLAPDGTLASFERVEIVAGLVQSDEVFPYLDGLWTVQANFTDGNNVLTAAVQTFQVVLPIPYTLSLQTAWTNATGGFKINSTATSGINIEISNSNAPAGTPVTVTSFIFLNTPPGRNFTTQLGAIPEEYGGITLSNTGIGGVVLLSLTHQALTQSSSLYYYSNSSQQWVRASNVTFVASPNPFGPGTIHCYVPVSELAETTIAVVNGPVIPEFPSSTMIAAFLLAITVFLLMFRKKLRT